MEETTSSRFNDCGRSHSMQGIVCSAPVAIQFPVNASMITPTLNKLD